MKILIFSGSVTSSDKEPIFCREEKEVNTQKVIFRNYPLTLLDATLDDEGVTADGIKYVWEMLPITINKTGKHITKYRDVIEERITIAIELKTVNSEVEI